MSEVTPEPEASVENPAETAGENSSAPEPQPHGESGPLPFYQRAANARQLAHEAIKEVETKVGDFYTSFRDRV